MALSPIVLFVYNRPWHTQQTLEALAKNNLADQSDLIVYADGPKPNASDDDLMKIQEVRSIVTERKWCKTVTIIESKTNKGLADSIIEGVTSVVNSCGKVIVLEDDIVTSPGFLTYMNEALTVYEKDEKVMHISGYMFPVKAKLPSTFYYNTASCWGWATWKRAWKCFNPNAYDLLQQIYGKNKIYTFTLGFSSPFLMHLEQNITGEIHTWAIKWYASFILSNGYALHPYPSLTNNIGFDASGQHSNASKKYYWNKLADSIPIETIKKKESRQARKAMASFYGTPFTRISIIKHMLKIYCYNLGVLKFISSHKVQSFERTVLKRQI